MLRAIFRVLFGFVLACLAAGFTKVMFAVGPNDALGGDPERIATTLEWSLFVATHSAVFAAPFAFLAVAISEWQAVRSIFYHVLVGVGISMAGFASQYMGEAQAAPSILNSYAAGAYAATGLVAGLVYWMFAGRGAGGPDEPEEAAARPAPKASPTASPAQRTPAPPSQGATS